MTDSNTAKKIYSVGDQLSDGSRNTKGTSTRAINEYYASEEYKLAEQENMRKHEIRKEAKAKKDMDAFWAAKDLEQTISKDEVLMLKELRAVRDNFKVLVVDDNTDCADMIRDIIKDECGFRSVDIAHNVEDALKLCADNKYDLILSDYNMPGHTGYDFWRILQDTNYKTNFVLISGYTPDQVRNLRQAGVLTFEKCMSGSKSLFTSIIKITKGYYARKIQKMLRYGFQVNEEN